MQDITQTNVPIKTAAIAAGQDGLAHDGAYIIIRKSGPARLATPATNTLIAGSAAEIDAEIARLGLTARPLPQGQGD